MRPEEHLGSRWRRRRQLYEPGVENLDDLQPFGLRKQTSIELTAAS
jgi:hypothetical protein